MSSHNHDRNPYEDDAAAVRVITSMLDGKAMRPPKYGGRKHISAQLSEVARDGLAAQAKKLGYVHAGKGNISMLLEAIGTGVVQVAARPLEARHQQ